MKKIIVLLISVVLFIVGFSYVSAVDNLLVGKRIVIDVGHGGKDSGTVYNNVKEKNERFQVEIYGKKLKFFDEMGLFCLF